jgi:hypothetical protein
LRFFIYSFLLLFLELFVLNGLHGQNNSIPDTLAGEINTNGLTDLQRIGLDESGRLLTDPEDLIKLQSGHFTLNDDKRDDHIVWRNVGPFNSFNTSYQNQGRINAISVHPHDKNIILIGSANGGIWSTTDGGTNWTNTTDDEGFSVCGVSSMVRHPADPNIIYAATSAYLGQWNSGRSYGIGIIMSEDGGNSWKNTGLQKPIGEWNSSIRKLVIDPNSNLSQTLIYAINTTSLFRYEGDFSALGKWHNTYRDGKYFSGPFHFGNVDNHDLEIDVHGTVWFANIKGVFKYADKTITKLTNVPVPKKHDKDVDKTDCRYNNPVKAFYDIEINKLNEIVLLINYYRFQKIGKRCSLKNKPYCITQSKDGGLSWSEPVAISTSGFAFPQLLISPYCSNVIYLEGGNRKMYKSINGGRILKMMEQTRNHVDVRCLLMYSGIEGDTTGSRDVLYVGTDGGISTSDDGRSWKDITGNGICNTNYFGLAITESDPGYILAGAQDGSINLLDSNRWFTTPPGGDNGDCLIDPRNKRRVYQSANASLCTHLLKGSRISRQRCAKIGDTGNRHELFPLLFNPLNPDVVFTASRSLKMITNDCKKIKTIGDEKVHVPKKISSIAISKDDTSVVYYALLNFYWNDKKAADHPENQSGIFKAKRVKDDWHITEISNNLKLKCRQEKGCGMAQVITDIAVDPRNYKKLWISIGGFKEGSKVFYSRNGGKKWKNISSGIPNLPATAIAYQGGRKKRIYAGTDFGVFFKDKKMKHWAYYGKQGPKCMVSDMEINHAAGKLVVSTLGRGIWEADLLP